MRVLPQRIADFQSASGEAPRTVRKNRLRKQKTHASIAQKRSNFGALPCSKPSYEPCAAQNHLRKRLGKSRKRKIAHNPAPPPLHRVPLTRDALTRCSPGTSSSRLTPPASRRLLGPWSFTDLADCRCRIGCHSLGERFVNSLLRPFVRNRPDQKSRINEVALLN